MNVKAELSLGSEIFANFSAAEYLAIFQLQNCLQCFGKLALLVGCQEEHPACKKLSAEVLAWLSIWSEVQVICIWSS